jgi:hypothetical protein
VKRRVSNTKLKKCEIFWKCWKKKKRKLYRIFGKSGVSKNRCIFMLGLPDLFNCLMNVIVCARVMAISEPKNR